MKNTWKKVLCIGAATLCTGAAAFGIGTAVNRNMKVEAAPVQDVFGTKNFIISNPYKDVDWDTWGQYKAATHVHTKMSDGDIHFDKMIENYYSRDYDALAITDHGTVNYGWTAKKSKHAIFLYNGASETPLTTTRYQQITTGSDRGGRPMVEIPLGIELNGMSTKKCHINSYYADAGDGDMEMTSSGVSGCVTAVSKSHKAGGITHINHVGEFMEANDCSTLDECRSKVYTKSFIDDFAQKVFRTFSSCIGIELVNKSDNRTKWDRYLYDELLMRLAPEGRTLWGFCEDDSHDEGQIAKNAQLFMMPTNTAANVRVSMETGAFFASSVYAKDTMTAGGTGDFPVVQRVTTDDKTAQLTFTAIKANRCEIVTGGQNYGDGSILLDSVSCDPSGSVVTFDLNNYDTQITKGYVRVYFIGDGGITYVQPFLLTEKLYRESCEVSFNVTHNGDPVSNPTIVVFDENETVIHLTSNNGVSITKPGTYSYLVSYSDAPAETGTFTIDMADFAYERDYSFNINLQKLPELQFTTTNCKVNAKKKIINGLTVGESLMDNFASATSSLGTVEIVPTKNGYGTGTKVNLLYKNEVIDSYTYVVYGDSDGDTKVDATDAILVLAHLSSVVSSNFDTYTIQACDVDNDGSVTLKDVAVLRRIGMEQEYSIDQNR